MIPEMLQDSNIHLMGLLQPYLLAIIIVLISIDIVLWLLYSSYKKKNPQEKKDPPVFVEKEYKGKK